MYLHDTRQSTVFAVALRRKDSLAKPGRMRENAILNLGQSNSFLTNEAKPIVQGSMERVIHRLLSTPWPRVRPGAPSCFGPRVLRKDENPHWHRWQSAINRCSNLVKTIP